MNTVEASSDERDALELVREIAEPTPLELVDGIDPRREVWLKREDLGPNRAFKWRGALCACAKLAAGGTSSVVTASTGNHGAATAWAATRTGLKAHVVVPVDASATKREIIASHGAEIHLHGRTMDEATAFGRSLAAELGAAWFEDGASEDQLDGTGTIGSELIDSNVQPAVVLAPMACGALIGGLARTLDRHMRPRPRIIGVQSTAFPRLGMIWRGDPDPGEEPGVTFADGLADSRIVDPAFSACRAYVDDVLAVDDEPLRGAIRELHERCGILVEGAAAAPLAAIRSHPDRVPGGVAVLVVSGGNIDRSIADEILAG